MGEAASPQPDWQRLAAGARELGVALDPVALARLRRYLELLLEWNRRFNLTAVTRPDEVLDRHFLDSLSCARAVHLESVHSLLDLGSGAGFPGLVLKIAFPHLEVTLVDAVEKRLRFLERVAADLELEGVRTVHARAEDAGTAARSARKGAYQGPLLREQFDLVTARAVAPLAVLVEWMLPFVRIGGSALAMKGPHADEELRAALPAISETGGGSPHLVRLTLPGTDLERVLVRIPKERPTPDRYPRPPGSARKRPLGQEPLRKGG